jgi:hypothetical protein
MATVNISTDWSVTIDMSKTAEWFIPANTMQEQGEPANAGQETLLKTAFDEMYVTFDVTWSGPAFSPIVDSVDINSNMRIRSNHPEAIEQYLKTAEESLDVLSEIFKETEGTFIPFISARLSKLINLELDYDY